MHDARIRAQQAFYEASGESAVMPDVCLAERVGFVPEGLAPLNDLRRIGTARIRQNL